MIWLIIIALYLAFSVGAYFLVLKESKSNSSFDKLWLSLFWPGLLLLYPIHWIHNK